jgi:hypothetical protein
MVRICFLAAALCLLLGCSDNGRVPDGGATRGFYYWHTRSGRFDWEDSTYLALDVDRLYVRFFDVDWSEADHAAIPVEPLGYWSHLWPDTVDVVPVVFITNETFTHLDTAGAAVLARQVHRKVMAQLNGISDVQSYALYQDSPTDEDGYYPDPYRQRSKRFDELHRRDSLYDALLHRLREVQFDCDWTAGTRAQYFAFLRETKKLFAGKLVSSTVRLYQYKYPGKAGVPPVQRGMLMCYNAGSVKDPETANSIFDRKEVMSYLEGEHRYPLALDYALPVFEWAVLYRDGTFQAILSAGMLRDDYNRYLEPQGDRRATVSEDFTYGYTDQGVYLRKDDQIRFERPDMKDVETVAAWLHEHKNSADAALTFYHLNHYDLTKYSQALEAMYRAF